ncbi:MAG: 4-alpha-glucanotransferase [Deltaproteobacteria bacterium]|nr:MAG: 4-alpha-glucanotransferase [Deltaproteobacteria bacterium]
MAHRFNLGRRAGILLPLSSVRGHRGDLANYGDVGEIARFLLSTGSTLWQLLPLNEVSPGQDSPYAASSSCALEPVFIDLDSVEDLGGELTDGERKSLEAARQADRVDFGQYRAVKRSALSRAFRHFEGGEMRLGGQRAKAFARFRQEHGSWLEDWALYRALHDQRQKSRRDWERPLRERDPEALERMRIELRAQIDSLAYMQWIADEQVRKGRREANAIGVKLLGDLPFMVAEDSADVWAMQKFFRFDATVGVPPDAYSADGQDWGLPVPRWEEMSAAGDPWLHMRADRAAELYDAFRVDHVVGLYRTYARPIDKLKPAFFVPAEEEAQRRQGERILSLFGEKAEVLAEDLGTVPDFVRASLTANGLPGTKVLRWENDQGVPRDVRRFPPASLAVTGTHDTESLVTWWEGLSDHERREQLKQPYLDKLRGDTRRFTRETHAALLELLYSAGSDAIETPINDALGWRERLNTPGTVGPHNWTWRLPWRLPDLWSEPQVVAMAQHLTHLADKHGRKG